MKSAESVRTQSNRVGLDRIERRRITDIPTGIGGTESDYLII